MRVLIGEHTRTAIASLKRSKSRALLTMIGVAIGVASITTILALSSGITSIISKQVADLGSNLAVIRPAERTLGIGDVGNSMSQTAYTTSPITERDLTLVTDHPDVDKTAPIMTLGGNVHSKAHTSKQVTIVATTPDFIDITPLSFADGQFIDGSTLDNTAVLGNNLSLELFGTEQSMGKTFSIRGQSFTVIGVLKQQKEPVNVNNVDYDEAVFISFKSGKLFNNGVAQIQQINVRAKDGVSNTKLRDDLQVLIQKNHDNQTDTMTLIGDEIANKSNTFFRIMNIVLSAIAGISLLVGGIGIMNIMMVSVTERTREIGIRKALGATFKNIMIQFLIESVVIGVIGGMLGILFGCGAALAISKFGNFNTVITAAPILISFGFSVGIGVLFGIYPARKAALLDPIEALRYE